VDRQIVIASVIALVLATAVKIHAPIEAGANTEMAKHLDSDGGRGPAFGVHPARPDVASGPIKPRLETVIRCASRGASASPAGTKGVGSGFIGNNLSYLFEI
jgi:hypothetical protein